MIYLDTSAFLKTVLAEPQSAAVASYLDERPDAALVSSALLVVEARRGVLRSSPGRLPRTDLALGSVIQLEISEAVLESASRLPDPLLRSLDAIHLATADLIRHDLDVLLTYDDRLAKAARTLGIPTDNP